MRDRMYGIKCIFKREQSAVKIFDFIQKHYNVIFRIFGAIALSAVMAAFILAFRSGWLPYAEDGDAFDTIYAIEESEQ